MEAGNSKRASLPANGPSPKSANLTTLDRVSLGRANSAGLYGQIGAYCFWPNILRGLILAHWLSSICTQTLECSLAKLVRGENRKWELTAHFCLADYVQDWRVEFTYACDSCAALLGRNHMGTLQSVLEIRLNMARRLERQTHRSFSQGTWSTFEASFACTVACKSSPHISLAYLIVRFTSKLAPFLACRYPMEWS